MTTFESKVKHIPYPQENVYRNISDLTNLGRIRDRLPGEKIQEFNFDADSVSIDVPPIGLVSMRIVERDEPKCVKFETDQSPLPFYLWIQMLPVDENNSKMKVTVKADIPLMLKGMVGGHLQDGVDKVAEALAMIPYK